MSFQLLLPLIQRELGLRARRAGNYWSRFAVGGLAMLACVPILLSIGGSLGPAQLGAIVFHTLVAIAFALCCLMCLVSSDAIASEKREGTLGLLLLTKVRPVDVILAKLVSSGAAALTSLLTLMPFLALPVLAGGVTGGETFRKALALLNALFLALALGIYWSARQGERFKAMRGAGISLLSLSFLPFLAMAVWPFVAGTPFNPGVFSPLAVLIEAGDNYYRVPESGSYWGGIIVTHALSWIFLVQAAARLRQMFQEKRTVAAKVRKESRPLDAVAANPNRYPLTCPPVEWLLRRQRGLNAIIWCGAVIMGGFGAFAFWIPNILVGCISGAFLAWGASRFFIEARRNGGLELLLTTPVGSETIVRDQWKVLSDSIKPPLIISVGIILPFVFAQLSRAGMGMFSPYPTLRAAFTVIVSTVALCRVGLWFGLKAPNQTAAILWTVCVVKGVPYLLSFGWIFLSSVLNSGLGPGPDAWYLLSLPPAVATIAFYFWIIGVAKRGVLREVSRGSPAVGRVTPMSSIMGEIRSAVERLRNWKTA